MNAPLAGALVTFSITAFLYCAGVTLETLNAIVLATFSPLIAATDVPPAEVVELDVLTTGIIVCTGADTVSGSVVVY